MTDVTDTDPPEPQAPPARSIALSIGMAALSLLLTALVLAYYAWTYGSLRGFAAAIDGQPTIFIDFITHYYSAGVWIYAFNLPASGYCYSAFFALCLGILNRFGVWTVVYFWEALQIATTVLLFLVPAVHFVRQRRPGYYLCLLATLLSLPVLHNFMWGQISTLLAVCTLAALCFYTQGRKVGAAALLALATSIKFYPGLFIIYFLLKREFKLVGMFAAWTLVFLVVVPAVRLGPDGPANLLTFHRASRSMVQQVKHNALVDPNSQYLPHVLKRLFHIEEEQSMGPLYLPAYAFSLANLVLLFAIIRARVQHDAEIGFALLLLSTPFLVETSWPHYFVYLPFCQVVIYQLLRRSQATPALLLQYGLLGLSILLASSVLFNCIGDFHKFGSYGLPFWSNAILLLLLYLQMLPRIQAGLQPRQP